MKKKMVLFIIIATLTLSTTANAENISMSESCELECLNDNTTVMYNELEVLQKLKKSTDEELMEAGYTKETIDHIKSDELEQELKQEIMKRAKMPVEELKNLGYSDEKIEVLKSLTGKESLEELSAREIFATLSCSAAILQHYYVTASNKTYMIANFSWSWSEGTYLALTDGAAIGWNHEFALDNSLSSTYNTHKITYISEENSSDKYTVVNNMTETDFYCSLDKFKVLQYQGGTRYFARKGTGMIALSQVGRVENVKFQFKYGHNTFLTDISLALPVGVGFSLRGAEEIYPSGVKNHGIPTIR